MLSTAELWQFAFDHGSHLIRDVVDAFDFEHVFVQPSQVRRHHDLAADNAGLIGAALLVIVTAAVTT
jgi:hypothetical protein